MVDFAQRGKPAIDMTGQTVDGWYVIRRAAADGRTARWLCRHVCSAAGERYIYGDVLRGGRAPKYCKACRTRAPQASPRPRPRSVAELPPPNAPLQRLRESAALSPAMLRRNALAAGLTQEDFDAVDATRPRIRGECECVARPCPYVGCRHHLYLDVSRDGTLVLNFPALEPDQLQESCSLDVAEWGEAGLAEIGRAMNFSRERARQLSEHSHDRLKRRLKLWEGHETERREVAV